MCMTLILDYWETLSLKTGCNLYSSQYRLCVLTVRAAHQTGSQGQVKSDTNMVYFRERDKPVVDAETFLATSVPKILISSLIIFLNLIAIISMCRNSSSKWISRGRQKGVYILPQSTQGLLHSLFTAYLFLGFLTLYSQISLSIFVLGEFRLFDDQGKECLTVNSLMIACSLAIVLHLVSLSVDRTLASYLAYGKYTSLSRGTVPLWLLSIWMPSIILGSLPLAGWKSNFSFCIFLHQFKDDYIRFVSGFYLTCLFLIPCLYIFFVIFLKPRKDPRILYRWHRKLQAHHRLTFALVLAINIICWTPFHCYLLMACLTCSYSYLGNGFTLEYLYMLALVPAIIIPLMFSIRTNAVDKCANKIAKCVHFSDEDKETNNNPLANVKKSPLFFIDDAIQQHQREQKNNKYSQQQSSSNTNSSGSSRSYIKNSQDGTVKAPNFFVPHYLPNPDLTSSNTAYTNNSMETFNILENNKYNKNNSNKMRTGSSSLKKKKEKEKSNKISNKKIDNDNVEAIYERMGTLRSAPLRNFCAYLNTKNNNNNSNSVLNQSFRSSTSSKCGFPIVHKTQYGQHANNTNN